MGDEGVSGDVQNAANEVVDAAQRITNSVVDLGEEAARTALGAVLEANRMVGEALQALSDKLVGN